MAHHRLDIQDNANERLIGGEAKSQNECQVAKAPRGSLMVWKPKSRVQITLDDDGDTDSGVDSKINRNCCKCVSEWLTTRDIGH